MANNPLPLVSVCLITYNHAKHIGEAIESVLAQQTRFGFELLIGEDDSSDGTRQIVLDYAQRYPERITAVLHDRSQVIHVNGRPTGRWNFFGTLAHARGQYIAFLEGDDFWTDPLKLQTQVDLMESRPDIVLCGHWVTNVDDEGRLLSRQDITGQQCPVEFSAKDALTSTTVHPNTWLFRRNSLLNHPAYELMLKLPAGDDTLCLALLARGNGHCIQNAMSVYRLHGGGNWSQKSKLRQSFEMLQFLVSTPGLTHPRHWPQIFLKATYRINRFLAEVLLASLRQRGVIREVQQILKTQTVLSRTQITLWPMAALVTLPIHLVLLVARKIKAGRSPSSSQPENAPHV